MDDKEPLDRFKRQDFGPQLGVSIPRLQFFGEHLLEMAADPGFRFITSFWKKIGGRLFLDYLQRHLVVIAGVDPVERYFGRNEDDGNTVDG
jgi:hypothetical protein